MILHFVFHFYVRVETVWVGKGNWNWNRLRKAGIWSWILHQINQDWNWLQICSHRKSRWTEGCQGSLLGVIALTEHKMSVYYYSSAVSKRLKHSCFFLHWPTLMSITYYCHWVMPFISGSRSLKVKVFSLDVDKSKYMMYYDGIPFFFSLFFKVVGKWMLYSVLECIIYNAKMSSKVR